MGTDGGNQQEAQRIQFLREEIAKKQRFDRLLFPRDFPGANSKERMEYLISITKEVPGSGERVLLDFISAKFRYKWWGANYKRTS